MDKNEITKRLVAGSARQDVAWLMSQIERLNAILHKANTALMSVQAGGVIVVEAVEGYIEWRKDNGIQIEEAIGEYARTVQK